MGTGGCVCQLPVIVTNTLDNQLMKRKGLSWLTVSEVSVHGCLTSCLWACGKYIMVRAHGGGGAHLKARE
jgi:hypothetical protein